MKKKSFFIRSLNGTLFLLKFGLISCALGLITYFGSWLIPESKYVLLQKGTSFISSFGLCLIFVSIVLLSIASILITVELKFRLKHDRLKNYFESVSKSLRFRQFLLQSESSKPIDGEATTYNPIIRQFNHYIKFAVIDIQNDYIYVMIPIPRSQQAQSILKDMEIQISSELSNQFPKYNFSSRPIQEGNTSWYIGSKR